MQNVRSLLVGIVCFAVGVAATRYYDVHRLGPAQQTAQTAKPAEEPNKGQAPEVVVNFEAEPLWAYGFDTIRMPGETAKPQAPPNRSGRTQVDGPTEVRDRDKTELNRTLARTYRETVFGALRFDRLEGFA